MIECLNVYILTCLKPTTYAWSLSPVVESEGGSVLRLEPRIGIEPTTYAWSLSPVAESEGRSALLLEPLVGIEPTTYALRVRCSTN